MRYLLQVLPSEQGGVSQRSSLPQQAFPPCAPIIWPLVDTKLWENILSKFSLLQKLHLISTASFVTPTKNSLTLPQSLHLYS